MEKRNSITYNFEDIKRYRQGLMSREEMHAFEKASMEDPFLADALEGYMEADVSLADEHLSNIKERVENKQEEKEKAVVVAMPKKSFPMWKVAAMVIIIAGAGLITYKALNKKNIETPGSIAEVPTEKPKQDPVPATQKPIVPANTNSNKEEIDEKKSTIASNNAKEADRKRRTEKNIALAKVDEKKDQKNAATLQPENNNTTLDEVVVTLPQKETTQYSKAAAASINKKTAVTVTGISISNNLQVDTTSAKPEGGWQLFEQYIADKITTDSAVAKNRRSASQIELEFTIDASGTPEDVNIISSTNTAINQQVIEAVSTGPKWTSQNQKARIRLQF